MTDVNIDAIPLQHGHGVGPDQGGCIWDLTIYRATNGAVWQDSLPCFNRVLVRTGQVVNDRLSPEGRERLRSFEPRLARALRARDDATEARINRRLALWCARRLELSADPRVKPANDVTERYLAGEATVGELENAVAVEAEEAAVEAAWEAAADDALLALLDELIDYHAKLIAEEGAMLDLDDPADYVQVGGS